MMSSHDVLEALDGRISYRQLDYWLRRGIITIEHDAHRHGSGNVRHFTPDEVDALRDFVESYEHHRKLAEAIRTGDFWRGIIQRSTRVRLARGRAR